MPSAVGKVVVITGASRGLGLATAREFARRRCTVVLTGRREAALAAAATECEALGGRAHSFVADVTDEERVRALV